MNKEKKNPMTGRYLEAVNIIAIIAMPLIISFDIFP
jgi:hypothetical protein